MRTRINQRRVFGSLSLFFLAAAFFTAFYDLSVSTRFVNTDSSWALFFQAYGKLPGLVTALAGATLLAANINREPRFWRPFLAILLILVIAIVTVFTMQVFMIGQVDVDQISRSQAITWAIGGVALFGSLAIFLSRRPSIYTQQVHRFGRVTVFTLVVGNLIAIQGLKQLWGRARFRDLSPDLAEFTAWYLPQGHTGDASFPSGHVGMAWLVLPLILLVPYANRRRRIAVSALIVVWGVVVAVSRVKVGAHYTSDVLFASAIAIAVFTIGAVITRPRAKVIKTKASETNVD